MPDTVIGWHKPSPGFGTALPHGSCCAITHDDRTGRGIVCGWPLHPDGTCPRGHGPRPEETTDATP